MQLIQTEHSVTLRSSAMEENVNDLPPEEHIVIIEDDDEVASLIEGALTSHGFSVRRGGSGDDGIELVLKEKPALVLLDIILPGMSGFDVCGKLKSDPTTGGVPVIILSTNDAEDDIVKGLNLGADDYVTKPFSPAVLIARIQSVLRRTVPARIPENIITAEGLSIDIDRFAVAIDGAPVELGVSEFRILHTLILDRGRVLTREQIIKAVHGENYPVTGRSVDVQIVSLRRKLGRYAEYVETVRGIGYRFVE